MIERVCVRLVIAECTRAYANLYYALSVLLAPAAACMEAVACVLELIKSDTHELGDMVAQKTAPRKLRNFSKIHIVIGAWPGYWKYYKCYRCLFNSIVEVSRRASAYNFQTI